MSRGMGALLRQAVLVVWLLLVWTLLWGRPSIDVLLSGVLVAVAVLGVSGLPALPLGSRVRWHRVPGQVARFALDLVRSSGEVLVATVRTGRGTRSSVLEVALPEDASDEAVVLACHRISSEPGSIVVDLDRHHDRLFVYQLDTPDEAAAERARARAQRLIHDVTSTVVPTRRRAGDGPAEEERDR